MASATTENTPLLNSAPQSIPARPQRTVTFNPTVSTSSPPPRNAIRSAAISPATQSSSQAQPTHHQTSQTTGAQHPSVTSESKLAAFNSKLRRRNSQPASLTPLSNQHAPKIGPQRTTKTTQKLKLLPDPEHGEDGPDEESGRDVYAQYTRIKDPTARRDAARLGKEDRKRLPRVTAYCTAASYRMDDVMRFLKGKAKRTGTAPKLFDECIYSPYDYGKDPTEKANQARRAPEQQHPLREIRQNSADLAVRAGAPVTERRYSDSAIDMDRSAEQRQEDLVDLHTSAGDTVYEHTLPVQGDDPSSSFPDSIDFDTQVHTPEVFLFDYGTVVIWGMSEAQEQRFLKEIAKFETEKLGKDDVQTEDFNFYYTQEYQARIYNDFISLRDKKNYMTKLAISHALSQSVKTSLYEDLVDLSISTTKDLPSQIATTGKVNLTRREINMQIGELFILRISIHLQGSVLDAPELMWAEPQLDPVYQAVRSYLEMDQRVGLLNERLSVIGDLLAVLKDQLAHTHGEYLEWIVIVLIAAEILVAAVNIVVDLYAGVD